MTPRQRTTAQFYATLASLRRESATDGALAALLPRFERILALSAPTSGKSGPKPPQAALLAALGHVQRETATVLRALLGDGTVAIPAPLRTASPQWRLTNGHTVDVWEPSPTLSTDKLLVLRGLAPLAELVKLPRFPFGHCPVCDTVFVRGINQKYCTLVCMNRGVAAERCDERRPYMREYMKRYRAAQRAARRKEK